MVSADVVYNKPAGLFTLTGTVNGAIGASSSAAYVFGFDRGQGTALLEPIASNVLFGSAVPLNADGTGSFSAIVDAGSTNLPTGSVHVSGDTISATFAASLIPTPGRQDI